MRGIRAFSRIEWLHLALGARAYCTPGQLQKAFMQLFLSKWLTAFLPEGPVYERVAMLRHDCPYAPLVRAFGLLPDRPAERWFALAFVEQLLKKPVSTRAGAIDLSRTGLAVAEYADGRVLLRPTDVRAAAFVNLARIRSPTGACSVRHLVAGFLKRGHPGRTRTRVTDELRLEAAIAMTEWGLDCPGMLLPERKRVRIYSQWQLPVREECQAAGPQHTGTDVSNAIFDEF